MQRAVIYWCVGLAVLIVSGCGTSESTTVANREPTGTQPSDSLTSTDVTSTKSHGSPETMGELASPVRLQADDEPIDIGKLSSYAHAGPWIADVDSDGDRDLLVGDFPGNFWFFENVNNNEEPVYTSRGKLQADGEDAKTPVY